MTHEAGFGNRKCEIFFATPGQGILPCNNRNAAGRSREHNLVADRPNQAAIERSLLRSERLHRVCQGRLYSLEAECYYSHKYG